MADHTSPKPRATEIDRYAGQRAREARVAQGLSQDAVARAVGVSLQQICKFELGRNRMSVGMLYRVAQALATPIDSFFPAETADETAATKPARVALEFNRAFSRIHNPAQRTAIGALVRALAEQETIQ